MYLSDSSSTPLTLDRSAAITQLTTLGYRDGDTVFLRGFFPDGDSRKHTDKGRKLEGTFLNLPWSALEQLQSEGRGIYFVVNGGGHKDDDVQQGRIFFYEHDDLDKELSRELWRHLGLPEPTLQVDTGGKSIHSYWVLFEPCSIAEWRSLQTDLLEYANADRKLKNPSRVMRLAGAFHIKPGREPIPSNIVTNTGSTYRFEQLRAIIPTSKQPEADQQIRWHEFEASFRLPITESIPLTECLTRSDRDLIERGSSQGERNSNGFKLAANLIATADYLSSLGQRYDDDPRILFEQYCERCTPPITSAEIESIWKSANKQSKGTSLSPEQIEGCIKGWAWRQLKAGSPPLQQSVPSPFSISNQPSVHSKVTPLRPNLIPLEQVTQQIRTLLTQQLTPSQLQAQKITLRSQTTIAEREFNQLWDSVAHDLELEDTQDDRAADLQQLVQLGDRRLRLSHYLHPHLAHPLEQVAEWMGVDAEALLTLLLPTAASLLNPQSRIVVKECIGFAEPFVFYTGVVTPSGNKKSPMLKVITSPLRKFQGEEDERFEIDHAEYERELRSASPTDPPHKPRLPREYFVDNVTGESLDQIKAQQPEHGLLLRKDELSGLFGSFNAYRGGKGSDREGILSGWNGDGVKVNRKGGGRLSLNHDATSVVGAIQPGKLRQLMGGFEDEQGDWARFLWYQATVKPHRLPQGDTRYSVGGLLEDLYQRLDQLAPQHYRFTPDAQLLYDEWHWQMELRRVAEPRQGMAAAIAKMQGYCARLAGILHILWALPEGAELVDEWIPTEQIRSAIKLAEFYLGQVTLIHAAGAAENGGLTEVLQQILEKTTQWGSATPRMLQSAIRGLRKNSAAQVRHLLSQLQEMGYGLVQAVGNRIKFFPQRTADTADGADGQVLTSLHGAELIGKQRVQVMDDWAADTADTLHRSRATSGVTAINEQAQAPCADTNWVNSQSVSTVSTLDDPLNGHSVQPADTPSADMSAASTTPFQAGDQVVLVGEANDRCKAQELIAKWTVRRVDGDQVVVSTERLGMRRYPLGWVTFYSRQ
jgi:hypothetical protein